MTPLKSEMTTPHKKSQCVSWFIEKIRMFRPIETTELSMEGTNHYVLQFAYSTNLFRQGPVGCQLTKNQSLFFCSTSL